jgi:hypothetical protein
MVLYEYEASKYGMYVADSSLHRYANGVWDEGNIPQPPGRIFDLASTESYLYALTDPDSPRLYRFDRKELKWTEVKFASGNQGYSRLQTIYGECGSDGKPLTDSLYVGASNSAGDYGVIYISDSGNQYLLPGTGLLTGAVFFDNSHFFAADGGGVYMNTPSDDDDDDSWSKIIDTEGAIKGMIMLSSSSIIAIREDGLIFEGNSSTSPPEKHEAADNSLKLTGPAAVWKDNGGNTLLLLAVRIPLSNSNSTYGYRELVLSSDSLPAKIELKEPGSDPAHSTVDDNKRYKDTIEPKPVNSLLQVPLDVDSNRTLFASVQGRGIAQNNTDGGLWSYRSRDGIRQWNAEE